MDFTSPTNVASRVSVRIVMVAPCTRPVGIVTSTGCLETIRCSLE